MGKKKQYIVSHACVNDWGELSVEGVGAYDDKESAVRMMNKKFKEVLEHGGYEYDEDYDIIVRDEFFCEAFAQGKMYIHKVVIDII